MDETFHFQAFGLRIDHRSGSNVIDCSDTPDGASQMVRLFGIVIHGHCNGNVQTWSQEVEKLHIEKQVDVPTQTTAMAQHQNRATTPGPVRTG